MPWPFWPPACLCRFTLFFLLIFRSDASPQWNNPNDFYTNSYQSQHGYVPPSAFGMSNQYGMNSNNFGAFNRPFITKPFVSYGNNFGATVGGSTSPSSGHQPSESDENPSHPASGPDTHPTPSSGISMPGMGSSTGGDSAVQGSPSPQINAALQQLSTGSMGPVNGMNQMAMTGINEMMPNGYGAGMTNSGNGMNGQWPGSGLNMGMTNNFGGPNCYGSACGAFPNAPAMSPNGFDYAGVGNGGMGSNLGQNVGGEDYNSAEESAEIAAGDVEQANLQRYAEYLNLVNRRYGIGMPGQLPNTPNSPQIQSSGANIPQGTGSFNGMGMNTMDMNGMMPTSGFMGNINGMDAMTNSMPISTSSGITGGVSSVGTNPIPTNTPSGMGALVGRYSAQPSMGFNSGIVGYGTYMPNVPNIYESQTYPFQWALPSGYGSGSLTNLAPVTNGMGIIDGYGPTGSIPAEYMGMGGMQGPTPYGYSGMQYPMNTPMYPQNIITTLYPGVTPSMGQSTIPPEVQTSKSREKSSQESSATSHEHIQSPPPATSIQALTQQIRRLPAVLYVDSKDQNGRHIENLLRDTYGLPLVSFYVDKIDKPKAVEKYLHQLTAHKGMPYLFICGTFIGSQEHVENYHKNKQIPQLVEYVCGEEKDKKGDRQSSHKDKKKKSGRKYKSRRQSKP